MLRHGYGFLRIATITLITIATALSSVPFLPRNESGALLSGAVAEAAEGEQTRVLTPTRIDQSAPELVNPMRGFYRWRGNETVPQPRSSFDAYQRYEWRDLEHGRGEYDFAKLERDVARAAEAGQKFSFRIRTLVAKEGSSVPDYVMGAMEQGWWADTNRDGTRDTYVPDWNDPDFLDGVERLLNALGERYDNDPRIGFIDIGIFGNWGEWHTSGIPYTSSSPARMTRENRNKLVDMHIAAFPNTQLVMMTDDEQALLYALQRSPRIGWRRDSLGWDHFVGVIEDMERLGPEAVTLFTERWKTAPIVTEFANPKFHVSPDTYIQAREQAERYHVSLVSNGNTLGWSNIGGSGREALIALGKAAGYRLGVAELTLPVTARTGRRLAITSQWVNEGVAPVYEDWQVWYQLRDSQGAVVWERLSQLDLRTLLPTAESGPVTVADELALPTSVAPGSYTLTLEIRDPRAYREPLALAITGRQADGSYSLGSVQVEAGEGPDLALENQIYLPLLNK